MMISGRDIAAVLPEESAYAVYKREEKLGRGPVVPESPRERGDIASAHAAAG